MKNQKSDDFWFFFIEFGMFV